MALAPRIELRQSQSLVMTPQLQQAIKLLQLSNLELAEYLAAEVEKNPLLELAPPRGPAPAPAAGGGAGAASGDGELSRHAGGRGRRSTSHLQAQIGAMRAPPGAIEAALILADELEEDGYLRVPLAEVAARHRLRAGRGAAGLALVQACDPAGVGARDLRECLALQLRERDRLDPAMQAMLDNLGARGARPAAPSSRRAAASMPRTSPTCWPSCARSTPSPACASPRPRGRGRRCRTCTSGAAPDGALDGRAQHRDPAAGADQQRLCRAAPAAATPATRAFISECSASASWLVRSLEQRARTILKVATEIVAARRSASSASGSPSCGR